MTDLDSNSDLGPLAFGDPILGAIEERACSSNEVSLISESVRIALCCSLFYPVVVYIPLSRPPAANGIP